MTTKQTKHSSSQNSTRQRTANSRSLASVKGGNFQIVAGPRGGGELLIRQRLGFTRPQFARLLPVSERSLAEIEKGAAPGESVMRSMLQIQRLIAALEEVIDPQVIGRWLNSPNESFGGLKPLEVIERGEIDRIWLMIYELRSGSPF